MAPCSCLHDVTLYGHRAYCPRYGSTVDKIHALRAFLYASTPSVTAAMDEARARHLLKEEIHLQGEGNG